MKRISDYIQIGCPAGRYHVFRGYESRNWDEDGKKEVEYRCAHCGVLYKDVPPRINVRTGEVLGR